jgi:uncharacterized protein (TIGR02271 family)
LNRKLTFDDVIVLNFYYLSKTDTKVQLSKEDVQVTKEPYVKEEVVVKKKPVTETRTVSDTVTSEKVDVSGSKQEE